MFAVFILVSAGYENLAFKRSSTDKADTPYAQLGVYEYEELPDRHIKMSSATQAAARRENVIDKGTSSRNTTESQCVELNPYEDISERLTSRVEQEYDSMNAVQ